MKLIRLILIIILLWGIHPAFGFNGDELRSQVEKMKKNPRGPFVQLRWFCNDGTLLAPVPYACLDHGGGVQHGEWTNQVKNLRNQGYYIANIYADMISDDFIKNPVHPDILKQMILEQFLIQADDGWIFRRARYYRGALQAEDEARGGEKLLLALLNARPEFREHFLLLREAARLLPHYHKNAPISEMRQLSLTLAEADINFEPLRIKIHVRPEAGDAERVRNYAEKQGKTTLRDTYERLAKTIDAVFVLKDIVPRLQALADQIRSPYLSGQLRQEALMLAKEKDPFVRFKIIGHLSLGLRRHLFQAGSPAGMLAVLNTGIRLEDEAFRLATGLQNKLSHASLGQSLTWLSQCTDILYGTGLISKRQHTALKNRFAHQLKPGQDLFQSRTDLIYTARMSDWSEQNLLFHFSRTIDHFKKIEPLCRRYVHDRLHASLLLTYSRVLERLMEDNSRQLEIVNKIWGRDHTSGITGLNPGLARGVLREPVFWKNLENFPSDSILVLPATTADLPPVTGIVTAGKGNILSHVQLLARNLGIPNVTIDQTLLPEIRSKINKTVVLAVSPRGVVRMAEYNSDWDDIFAKKLRPERRIITVDVDKLALDQTGFVTLAKIRAKDSGRIAGPKAANLGELKHHFPDAVTDGVVIPFGRFRKLLNQPLEPGGPKMFDWMKNRYRAIHALKDYPLDQKPVIKKTLARIRSWILTIDPGDHFRHDLKQILEKTLGKEGSFGVFVRSDTNVEDLPGFTGAGLNLTVPHVVGFDNILSAVLRVWASPFTLRSFGWRHAYLKNPEHVYASVLLMKTVPVEKSGVLVTKNLDTGESGWMTIAVNEGIGGAVSDQTAEELRVHVKTGEITLLSRATEPLKRVVLKQGGMAMVAASGRDAVLNSDEIEQLIIFAKQLPQRFPALLDDKGQVVPADVEFGFYQNKLVLFQIRPFLDDARSRHDTFLSLLDRQFYTRKKTRVDLNRIPEQESP